jgi:uncharacterized protein YqjF (DUF2071 family)
MARPILTAEWQNLALANYAVDPALLKPSLPRGVELDFFGETCYVSLVGFLFVRTRLLGVPVPFHRTFEEVNLRFYVRRLVGTEWRRGVVFIQEMVPRPAIAWSARLMYREPYVTRPMRHRWENSAEGLEVEYAWKWRRRWNWLAARADPQAVEMATGSEEEFITEHYYGYNGRGGSTREYVVEHPRWRVHPVHSYDISCDFKAQYGPAFGFLAAREPDSVMLAAGAPVAILPFTRLE